MKGPKAISKISEATAQEEADRILGSISRREGSPRNVVEHLVRTYTHAAVAHVLSVLGKTLAQGSCRADLDAAAEFLSELSKSVNSRSGAALVRAIIKTAIAVSVDDGPEIAAQALIATLRDPRDKRREESIAIFQIFALESVSACPSAAEGIMARVLVRAIELGTAGSDFLVAWATSLRILLAERCGSIGTPAASLMLKVFAELDPAGLPPDLLITCPFLISQADPKVVRSFEDTAWGRRAARLAGSLNAATERADSTVEQSGRKVEPPTLPEEDAAHDAIAVLVRRFQEQGSRARERESVLAREAEEARMAASDAVREQRSLREENTALHGSLEELTHETKALKVELTRRGEELARWKAEVTHREHESESRLRLRDEQSRSDLQARLSRPADNVRNHIVSLLEERGSETKIRVLAAAFDSLHTRLLAALGEESGKRIPARLLAASEEDKE